jgi:hypothetical protein
MSASACAVGAGTGVRVVSLGCSSREIMSASVKGGTKKYLLLINRIFEVNASKAALHSAVITGVRALDFACSSKI